MTTQTPPIDQFLLLHSARADKWREIVTQARDWATGKGSRAEVDALVTAIAPLEEFHAYPGPSLLAGLTERISSNDASGTAALARRISNALMTRSYRDRPGEWDLHLDDSTIDLAGLMPPTLDESDRHRPYFEVLYVSSLPAAQWPAMASEIRRLRRPEDAF